MDGSFRTIVIGAETWLGVFGCVMWKGGKITQRALFGTHQQTFEQSLDVVFLVATCFAGDLILDSARYVNVGHGIREEAKASRKWYSNMATLDLWLSPCPLSLGCLSKAKAVPIP